MPDIARVLLAVLMIASGPALAQPSNSPTPNKGGVDPAKVIGPTGSMYDGNNVRLTSDQPGHDYTAGSSSGPSSTSNEERTAAGRAPGQAGSDQPKPGGPSSSSKDGPVQGGTSATSTAGSSAAAGSAGANSATGTGVGGMSGGGNQGGGEH